MKLQLNQNKTVKLNGGEIAVTYKVPNAIEIEEVLDAKSSNSEIFKKFVTKIESKDYEDLNGAYPSEVIKMPGTYSLVKDLAFEIINNAMLSDNEKKLIVVIFSALNEGYDYSFKARGEDRTVNFKFIENVSIRLIEEALQNKETNDAIRFYQKYRLMGFPYGPWGNNPNKMVEIVELLQPLDEGYHPRLI